MKLVSFLDALTAVVCPVFAEFSRTGQFFEI